MGYIPEMMRKSVFITIPKKGGTAKCEHQMISKMSQIGKRILRVIHTVCNKIDSNVSQEQYGFRKGKGTASAVFSLRMIIGRRVEVQKDIYMCFVDFEKAFNTGWHEEVVDMLQEIGVDGKDMTGDISVLESKSSIEDRR